MQPIHAAGARGSASAPSPQGISIVYPTRDRPEFITQSLTALLQNSVLPDEIVVIDQSRTDATRRAIATLGSPLIVHVPSTETGLSRARNMGIRSSRFSIIGFIDDDCIPARNWIAAARSFIQRMPESAVWIGKVFYDARYISDDVIQAARETCYRLKGTNDPWRFGPAGGNSFFARTTFDRVGLFDPLLGQGGEFPGAEDGDMVYRILKANLQVSYSDLIRSYHLNWRNEDEELRNTYNYGLGFGALMAKHVAQGDYYLATVVFGRHFLPNYFLVPLCLLLGRRRKFRHSLKWSQSIAHGFFGWHRLHRAQPARFR
jgi:glycosyltransferase involved in cell wall biosynthesis